MIMDKMRFGSFVWPENPETYEEICTREPRYARLSQVRRTMKGSGAFTGSGAYASFKTLSEMVNQTEAAKLIHPVWGERNAYLVEIQSAMQPREDYVAYSFTFLEADSSGEIPQ